ncbi:MAG: hypothetical protein KDC38_18475, partial [Planctomycetes bacterium]|nr:hypothetical protein [Planctomycetota bacterium]
ATTAMALAIGGHFRDALELAGRLSPWFDRGQGERLRAAIHMLSGDRAAAKVALNNARDHDAQHPKTLFLLEYVDADPYAIVPLTERPVSEYLRWHHRFSALRLARDEHDPAIALEYLSPGRWVDANLRVVDWPEVTYLIWLERIRKTAESGERDAAMKELGRFRQWWPRDRPATSRVSAAANQLEVELEGAH